MPVLLALVAVVALTGPARAESQEEQARRHFVAGQRLYGESRFEEALQEFEVGYRLSPRPEFLVNFAQALRRLGRYDRAIVECERYLATAPPPPLEAEARRLLSSIREEAARVSAKPEPPTKPEPAPEPVPVAKPAPAPIAQPAPVVAAPVEKPAPKRSRKWVWAVVGTVAALAVGGLVAGLVVAFPSDRYPSAPLGSVSFR
jgi:outer membrane biosynthesis protein TonB